jgi:hypothetical protein
MERPNFGEGSPMAAMAESAKRPLPRLGSLDQRVEEIAGSVLKLRAEGIG